MSLQRCALVLSVAFTGCAPESILIAESEDAAARDAAADVEAEAAVEAGPDEDAGRGGDSGTVRMDGGTSGPVLCLNDQVCGPRSFCAKQYCDDPFQMQPPQIGTCAPRPRASSCSGEFAPECGCDGVTYFNECVRLAQGVNRARKSECQRVFAQSCSATRSCSAGSFCALPGIESCDVPSTEGRCWALPSDCSATRVGDDAVLRCTTRAGAERECVSLCDAIREQVPFVWSPTCTRRPQPTFP